ncbi:MAG TPA: 2'-5' RNA ligase family protein [Verrucomicrobiae bacterium]|nr:2'-5' RNA ligase family protein [Verrucomicrobiae bacterium]
MAFLVITHPEFQQPDFDWIQEYRKQNDRQFSIVDPHFTLVFAVKDIDRDTFVSEVKQKLEGIAPFHIDLKAATINQDDSGKYFHEFLVPDAGNSEIIKLHDKLYSGILATYRRYDIDFIPHISIGDSEDVEASKSRVEDLNAKDASVRGSISSVDIIEFANGKVSLIEKLNLTT